MIPEISFFCPAYHDEKNLPRLIPHVYKFLSEISDKFEIIIVEDGSPDKTGQIADELAKQFKNIRVIHHSKNLGYGATLKDGFMAARYDYVMYTDGDFQYDVNEFKPVIHFLAEYDILSGYVTKKAVTFRRVIQSFVYNLLIRIMFFVNLKDANCSMKIYKKKVLDAIEIKSDSAFIDTEMLIKARRKGFKIKQFPVRHYKRDSGLASGSRPSVIVDTIKDMIKFRLGLL
jgi:glycosyltransferase involved in cell wall biosynthesis